MKKFFLIALLISIAFVSCDVTEVSDTSAVGGDWLVPSNEVFDGGPGRDGIPSVDNPKFINQTQATFMNENDLIIGIKVGNEVRGYPHPVLDWHEITNDEIGSEKFAITYCPLTGSAIGWDRVIDGRETTFGVSGLLYNTNLIPYDRLTQSNWSQMRLQSVNGDFIGKFIEPIHVIETSWTTWKSMFPDAKVMSTETGTARDYGDFPYGDYRTNNQRLLFPVNNNDSRLPGKDRVLGLLVGNIATAYNINDFGTLTVTNESLEGTPIVVAGSGNDNFAVAYERKLDSGEILELTPLENEYPVIMTDSEGNKWDVFGVAVEGNRQGTRLKPTISFISYWFAWAAFYPHTGVR